MAFAGFDSLAYPGDQVMAWLRQKTNLVFVGFYLAPAPSRADSRWMDRRGVLAGQDWGFAPIYVGQQEPGAPGSHILTPGQGEVDARDASTLMNRAGFPSGSYVYIDLETGGPATPATFSYVQAWAKALTDQGTYKPGVYCSYTTAPSVKPAVGTDARFWVFHLTGPAPGPDYPPEFPTKDPGGSGFAAAVGWQYAQNKVVELDGGPVGSVRIDLDTATVADPSV
jgi:hypothetical protein